jgi:hypothetical protein
MNEKRPITILPAPGRGMRQVVSGGLIARWGTVEAWCREIGIKPEHFQQAVMGRRNGPVAMAVREMAIADSGFGHLPRAEDAQLPHLEALRYELSNDPTATPPPVQLKERV